MSTMRADIHRPSAIQPDEYSFVSCIYLGGADLDPGAAIMNAEAKAFVRRDMERTGGRYSNHEHGGTCHICGAQASYLAVYYHRDTNTYIHCGEDCARNMDMGDVEAFNPLRRAIADARKAMAGKKKAKLILAESGLSRAWELYCLEENPIVDRSREVSAWPILRDIVHRLVKYGSASDKQMEFLESLVDQIDNFEERKREREERQAAERSVAEDCPNENRVEVLGEVVSIKYDQFYNKFNMLVKTDRGFKVWGSVPKALMGRDEPSISRGDRVKFVANLVRSDKDEKFGFFKRPTKAERASCRQENS